MKENLFIFLLTPALLATFTFLLHSPDADPSEQPNDEAAIKEVLYQDTQAFLSGDYDAWLACYTPKDYVIGMSSLATGSNRGKGWKEFHDFITPFIQANSKNQHAAFAQENMTIHVNGSMAMVYFNQVNPDGSTSWEHRVLEKTDGAWKIISVMHLNNAYQSHYVIR